MNRTSCMISFCLATLAGSILGSRLGSTSAVFADDKESAQDEVVCKRLVVEDENGKARIVMFVDKPGPAIQFIDVNSKTRMRLGIEDEHPVLRSKNVPFLAMFGHDGSADVFLQSHPVNGNQSTGGALSLASQAGAGHITLAASSRGETKLELAGEDGGTISLSLRPRLAAMFCILHPNGEMLYSTASNFEKKKTDTIISDPDGKELWKAP